MAQQNNRRKVVLTALLSLALMATGCQLLPDKGLSGPANQVVQTGFNRTPRMRGGSYPSAIIGTPWCGPELGTHGYYFRPFEKDGMAYTCRGGHIDIAHLRIAVDWTAYLAAETYRHVMKRDADFSYKLAVDRSRDYVHLTYPPDWDSLPESQRSEIATQVALAAGPYLAYTMTTWHEILTWFGFKCTGLPTEFPSAFSWEDSYSNVLGTVIAVNALQDMDHSYDQAVTLALDLELAKLGLQPAAVAKHASESVKGQWSSGDFIMLQTIRKRNFDTGLEDGMVTPTVVPGVADCPDIQPQSYPAPSLAVLAQYGFTLTLEIEPREWESGKILRVAYAGQKPQKRVSPSQHFPVIMAYIRAAASTLYPEFNYTAYEDGAPPHTQTASRWKDQLSEAAK